MKVSKFKELANLEEWKSMIAQRLESKLSVSEWCKRSGISQQQYYYRLRKVRESAVEEIENNHGVLVRYTPSDELLKRYDIDRNQDKRIIVRYGDAQAEFSETMNIGTIAQFVKELNQ